MSRNHICGLEADLVTDIIRYSDGRVDPFRLANDQLRNFVERSIETAPELWGDRLAEVAEKYAPDVWERWSKEEPSEHRRSNNQSLYWKGVTVPAGWEVRMRYKGTYYSGTVSNGGIVDAADGQTYSPSQWASKVANGTSRSAWRDLRFKDPFSNNWVSARALRRQAREQRGHDGQVSTAPTI
jgi:hypothetical protein